MLLAIDPRVDYAFKRIFGSEENRNVLRHLLNSFLSSSLPQPISEITLLNPFCLSDVIDDKLSILDIKARDEAGREYIIEVQLFPHANFPERLLYYAAKEYAGQLSEGEPYSNLRPVIVLCFVNGDLFEGAKEFHSRFEFVDLEQHVRFSDHLQIHVIELPKFMRSLDELRDDGDRWTYFLQHGREFDDATLPAPLATVPEIRQATGTLTMVSRTPAERERYEAQLKFKRDEQARLEYALNEGTRIGLARGIAEGREIGVAEGLRDMILRIGRKRLGPPPAEFATRLQSESDLGRLQDLADQILDCSTWDALIGNDTE